MKEFKWTIAKAQAAYMMLSELIAYNVHRKITQIAVKNRARLKPYFDIIREMNDACIRKYAEWEEGNGGHPKQKKDKNGAKLWKYDGAEDDASEELNDFGQTKEKIKLQTVSADLLNQSREYPRGEVLEACEWMFTDVSWKVDGVKIDLPESMREFANAADDDESENSRADDEIVEDEAPVEEEFVDA